MRHLILTLATFLAFAVPASAQEIVAELSHYDVELTPSFKGQDLFIFGAIKHDGKIGDEKFDVVIVIKGEPARQLVRKKERVFGFWLNTKSQTFEDVPGFFGYASTKPLDAITDEETLSVLQLGMDELDFVKSRQNGTEEDFGYVEGLIRNKQAEGLFQIGPDDLPVMSDILFRADFFFPAKVHSGTYEVSAYLFQDGNYVGQTSKAIRVEQGGLARSLFNLAHENPTGYGMLAILMALMAGWLAGYITTGRKKLG